MSELMVRTLEELDGLEAKLMLLDLPPLDVDRVSLLGSQSAINVSVAARRCKFASLVSPPTPCDGRQ